MCFSCGKPGNSANCCPTLDDPFHAAGMVGGKGRGWLCDDFTPGSSGASPSGKRRLIREGGFTTRISNNVRPQDPGGGGGCNTDRSPPGGVAVWTGAPPLPARVVPQSVPVRVSAVLVEETPGGSAGECTSALVSAW